MRRAWLLVMLCACQQQAVAPSAALQGLRDMVRVKDFIFATSTERDELRVLDLVTDVEGVRKYVRAPNPIQALSIPVLKRPTTLVTDLFYPADGGSITTDEPVEGPYVYAASPGTAQISIVWAEDLDSTRGFTEVARLSTIAPVTAMAALGADPAGGGAKPDTLWFATFDGTTTTLFRLKPAPPETIATQKLQADVKVVFTRQNESIVDMISLPGGLLALATRAATGKTGTAGIYDGITGALRVTLQFPSPVRALYTHGAYTDGTRFGPARRIYGLLDEDACGSTACGGLVAIEADTGERVLSAAGRALPTSVPIEQRVAPPIAFGNGLIQSVSLAPEGAVTVPGTGGAVEALPVLGMVTLSNGQLGFFRANDMQHLMAADAGASAVISIADGGTSTSPEDAGTDFPVVTFGNGAARDEELIVIGNGIIPGLGGLAPAGDRLPTPSASRAQVGDLVDGCDAGVSAIEADAVRTTMACSGPVSVRAAGAEPYVILGTLSGYMGRSGPGQTFSFPGSYFVQFPDYDPRRPAYQLSFPTQPALGLEERYTLSVEDGYLPTVMLLTSGGCSTGATTLPGTALIDRQRNVFFVAYPSANAIVEISPLAVRRTFSLDTGFSCWR